MNAKWPIALRESTPQGTVMFNALKALWRRHVLSDDEFRRRVDEVVRQCPAPVFWLLGKTGSGKTSIVRYLTDAEDTEIGNGFRPQTRYSRQFDFPSSENPLLKFIDTRGIGERDYDPTLDIARFDADSHVVIVTARLKDQALDELVSLVRQVRESRPDRPIVLVLTCLHEVPDPEAAARLKAEQQTRFGEWADRVVEVDLTLPEDGFPDPHVGGPQLKSTLLELLPEAYRQAILSLDDARRTLRELHERRASPVILGYSLLAGTVATAPLPWVDIPFVLAIQTRLVYRLAELYEVDVESSEWSALAAPLGGRLLLRLFLRESLKFIPVVGIAANAAVAYAYTYGLGRACCWYFGEIKRGHAPTQAELEDVWREQWSTARQRWHEMHASNSEAKP